jgi:cyclase
MVLTSSTIANIKADQIIDDGDVEDIYRVFMYAEADAALAASIFHFREQSITQAKSYLKEKGIPVWI